MDFGKRPILYAGNNSIRSYAKRIVQEVLRMKEGRAGEVSVDCFCDPRKEVHIFSSMLISGGREIAKYSHQCQAKGMCSRGGDCFCSNLYSVKEEIFRAGEGIKLRVEQSERRLVLK